MEGEKGVNVLDEIHYEKISPMGLVILFMEAPPLFQLQRSPSNGSRKVPNGLLKLVDVVIHISQNG
jgi:hypothetical protein